MSQSTFINPIGLWFSCRNTGIVSENHPEISRQFGGTRGNAGVAKSIFQSGRPSAGKPLKLSNP